MKITPLPCFFNRHRQRAQLAANVRRQMRVRGVIFAISLIVCACASAALVRPSSKFTAALDREEELLREQLRLFEEAKSKIASMEPGPRRDELRRRLAEIEARMRAQQHVLYIPASSNLTPEMTAYFTRMMRRMEDCGTRHFPSRDGKNVYGVGSIAVSIDSSGELTETEILKPSGDALLDSQMVRIARATSPFGAVPEKPTRDTSRPYTKVVVFAKFHFDHNEKPRDPIPVKEQCKWH